MNDAILYYRDQPNSLSPVSWKFLFESSRAVLARSALKLTSQMSTDSWETVYQLIRQIPSVVIPSKSALVASFDDPHNGAFGKMLLNVPPIPKQEFKPQRPKLVLPISNLELTPSTFKECASYCSSAFREKSNSSHSRLVAATELWFSKCDKLESANWDQIGNRDEISTQLRVWMSQYFLVASKLQNKSILLLVLLRALEIQWHIAQAHHSALRGEFGLAFVPLANSLVDQTLDVVLPKLIVDNPAYYAHVNKSYAFANRLQSKAFKLFDFFQKSIEWDDLDLVPDIQLLAGVKPNLVVGEHLLVQWSESAGAVLHSLRQLFFLVQAVLGGFTLNSDFPLVGVQADMDVVANSDKLKRRTQYSLKWNQQPSWMLRAYAQNNWNVSLTDPQLQSILAAKHENEIVESSLQGNAKYDLASYIAIGVAMKTPWTRIQLMLDYFLQNTFRLQDEDMMKLLYLSLFEVADSRQDRISGHIGDQNLAVAIPPLEMELRSPFAQKKLIRFLQSSLEIFSKSPSTITPLCFLVEVLLKLDATAKGIGTIGTMAKHLEDMKKTAEKILTNLLSTSQISLAHQLQIHQSMVHLLSNSVATSFLQLIYHNSRFHCVAQKISSVSLDTLVEYHKIWGAVSPFIAIYFGKTAADVIGLQVLKAHDLSSWTHQLDVWSKEFPLVSCSLNNISIDLDVIAGK